MMHFRPLQVDLGHVSLISLPNPYGTCSAWLLTGGARYEKECILTASDVGSVIQNMGMERCSYFYIHRKKKTLHHMFIIFAFMCTDGVAEACLSILSLESEVLRNLSFLRGRSL